MEEQTQKEVKEETNEIPEMDMGLGDLPETNMEGLDLGLDF